ncbi:MAG: 3'-5' exonuclease [Anaerolineae bacterium]
MIEPDALLIVDVESTCWEGQPPGGQQSEIIEIGVCWFDVKSGRPHDQRSVLVKPQRSKVSPFCTSLTTLTQEEVNQGLSFVDACALLEVEYDAKAHVWGSWGAYDLRMFQDQCRSFGTAYPFGSQHVNLKRRFADRLNQKKQVGMAAALRMLDLPLMGTHHRGGDDAYNIGCIAAALVKQFGVSVLAPDE